MLNKLFITMSLILNLWYTRSVQSLTSFVNNNQSCVTLEKVIIKGKCFQRYDSFQRHDNYDWKNLYTDQVHELYPKIYYSNIGKSFKKTIG